MTGLKELNIPYDIKLYGDCPMRTGDKTVMQFYLERVSEGMSPRFAETLALQEAPGIGITTNIYLQHQRKWGSSILDQYNGNHKAVDRLRKGLAKNGYRLKDDDIYIPTAAAHEADPRAIVNHTQDLGSLKNYMQERGVECHGAVETEADPRGPATIKQKLHPRLVNRIRKQKIAKDPDFARIPIQDQVAEITHKHGTRKDTL